MLKYVKSHEYYANVNLNDRKGLHESRWDLDTSWPSSPRQTPNTSCMLVTIKTVYSHENFLHDGDGHLYALNTMNFRMKTLHDWFIINIKLFITFKIINCDKINNVHFCLNNKSKCYLRCSKTSNGKLYMI